MSSKVTHSTTAEQAVFARLDRALKLHGALDASINEYSGFEVETIKSYDPLTGVTELKLSLPSMPTEWGFLASEVLHHARSSLDNAIVAVAESRQGSLNERWKPTFPLSSSNENFEKYGVGRNLKGVDQELIEIVRSLQPFTFRGKLDGSLRSLAQLNNADKHSALAIVGAVFTDQLRVSEISVGFLGGHNGATLHGHSTAAGTLADGHTLLSVETNAPFKEAHFETVKFLDHKAKFETVIDCMPSFSVDDFILAIEDVRTVCETLFRAA